MDFITILQQFAESGFEWVGIALLVWCLVVYLPKRDSAFLDQLTSLRNTLEEAERDAHKEIIKMIQEHDTRATECSHNIAQILKEIQTVNMKISGYKHE